MSLGIPVVSFKNNYLKLYDQTDWSPAEEFIKIPEILIERGDFAQMKRLVSRLIEDQEYRHEMARRCQEDIEQNRGDAASGVRKCEEVCLRVLAEASAGDSARDPRGAEVEELTWQLDQTRVPKWVTRTARQLKRGLRFGERVLDRVGEGRIALRKS